jgi:DNA-binding transcriptional regulator YiaG
MELAHRLVCEHFNGPAPTPEHQAAHSCGHRSCVNHKHLRWATASANQMDRPLHGTSNRGEASARARLTEDEVRQIRSLRGVSTQREIAELYGVDHKTICNIHRGLTWRHII